MSNADQQETQLNISIVVSNDYEDETPLALMQWRAEREAEILTEKLGEEYPRAEVVVRVQRNGGEPPAPTIYHTADPAVVVDPRPVQYIQERAHNEAGEALCEHIREQAAKIEVYDGDTTYRATQPIYVTRIAIGDAHREGRAPDTDTEYVTLVWNAYGGWLVEDNAGVQATVLYDYEDMARGADSEQELAYCERLSEVVDAAIQSPGELLQHGDIGTAALKHLVQWGWLDKTTPPVHESLRRTIAQDGGTAAWFDCTAHAALADIDADWRNSEAGDTLAGLSPEEPIRCYADGSINVIDGYGLVQEACHPDDYPLSQFIEDAEAVGADIQTDPA